MDHAKTGPILRAARPMDYRIIPVTLYPMTETQALATRTESAAPAAAADRDAVLAETVAGWLLERPSANTRKAYRGDLARFVDYLAAAGVHPLEATRTHAAAWAESMRQTVDESGARTVSESTIARRLSVVSSMYGHAVSTGALGMNPLAAMKRPARAVDEDRIVWLDTPAMRRFLAAAAAAPGKQATRNHALLAVMLTTGARTTEVLAADVADLGTTGGHRVLYVTRKGGKRQALPLAPWVAGLVDAYVDGRAAGPLFATTGRGGTYGRMDEPSLLRLVRRTGAAAGLANAEQLHPHSLRHSAITGALEAGGSLRDVQAMAGHADPRTTERYDRMRGRLDKSPVYALAAALAVD